MENEFENYIADLRDQNADYFIRTRGKCRYVYICENKKGTMTRIVSFRKTKKDNWERTDCTLEFIQFSPKLLRKLRPNPDFKLKNLESVRKYLDQNEIMYRTAHQAGYIKLEVPTRHGSPLYIEFNAERENNPILRIDTNLSPESVCRLEDYMAAAKLNFEHDGVMPIRFYRWIALLLPEDPYDMEPTPFMSKCVKFHMPPGFEAVDIPLQI